MPENKSGVSWSAECAEGLAMLAWGIPILEWYRMPRAMRVKSVAIYTARRLIDYVLSGGE